MSSPPLASKVNGPVPTVTPLSVALLFVPVMSFVAVIVALFCTVAVVTNVFVSVPVRVI